MDLVLGLFAFTWARRANFSSRRAWAWAIFVLCFGPAGLLAFRLAADWPAEVRCPQCGARRPVRAEECPACHAAWPAPEPTGIEIFDGGGDSPAAST